MRTAVNTFFTLAIAGLMISCGNNAGENHDQEASKATHELTEPEAEHDGHAHNVSDDDIGVKLDNGKKWSANAETTAGINNMIKLMNDFSRYESGSAYAELNKDLQNEFALIFERCTMTGESHNQLHNYLVPIKDMFAGLISSDINTCKSSFQKLSEHLGKYSNYFE